MEGLTHLVSKSIFSRCLGFLLTHPPWSNCLILYAFTFSTFNFYYLVRIKSLFCSFCFLNRKDCYIYITAESVISFPFSLLNEIRVKWALSTHFEQHLNMFLYLVIKIYSNVLKWSIPSKTVETAFIGLFSLECDFVMVRYEKHRLESCYFTGIILFMRPNNDRRRYSVTPSLIGWAHTQYDPFNGVLLFVKTLLYVYGKYWVFFLKYP